MDNTYFANQKAFNEKYDRYIAPKGKGLDVPISAKVFELLDAKFQSLINIPNFLFHTIEYRMGNGYFKAYGPTDIQISEIEDILTTNKE
jgi:hypothetical protein